MIATVAIATLLGACSQSAENKVTFEYSVRGNGEAVVSYRPASGPLLEENVTLPWTSDEYESGSEFQAVLRADASEGSVECVVRHHDEGRDYGGDGAGVLTQTNGAEDRNECTIEQEIREVLER